MTRVTGRNIAVLLGSYYLSFLLGMPFFIAFGKVAEGHVYSGDIGSLIGSLVWTIPFLVYAALAAVMSAWLVESAVAGRSAWGLAACFFVGSLAGHHWHRPPTTIDLVGELLQAAIPASLVIPVFRVARRRFEHTTDAA
jgi:hypothetical protein